MKQLNDPSRLPGSADEAKQWQEANARWWESHPMRYDWKAAIGHPEFSREFYEEVDRRFFRSAAGYLPPRPLPFDSLINFAHLRDKDVLEIGVGSGSHAGLLAAHAKRFVGIDLTAYAVRSTRRRLDVFGLPGTIVRMDAEHMAFPDSSFDFIWSWGVIHHSANTRSVLREIARVLRPGGKAVIMVYYRGLWPYYVTGFLQGLVSGKSFRGESIHRTMQEWTDGAIARYYRMSEWSRVIRESTSRLVIEELFTAGPKSDIVLLPAGRIKAVVETLLPTALNRILVRRLRMGSFLVCRVRKAAAEPPSVRKR
jgi:SAM-dependent methyltransferase